jgi:membrane-bound serine protease (ClpP class)
MSALAVLDISWSLVVVLFLLGIVFSVAEVLVPSGGVLAVLAALSFLGAVVAGFLVGWKEGLVTLLATAVLTPVVILTALRLLPRTPIGRRLILQPPATGKAGDLAHLDAASLEGRVGVARTLLRPAGKITIDGRPIDCVTEGEIVQPGTKVKVLTVRGAKVVVRPVEDAEA